MTRAFVVGLVMAACVLSLGRLPEAGAMVVDRIVATVDGSPITQFELERFIRLNGGVDPNSVTKQDRAKALEMLIGETLVRLESRRLGLGVSQQDVDLYIEEIKRGNNLDESTLTEALAQQGFTVETYKVQVAKELLKNQLIMRQIRDKVQVTSGDVQKFYVDNKEMFAKTGSVHIRQIFFVLSPQASEQEQQQVAMVAQRVVQELQAGRPFPAVAKKYSQGPEAADGGSLGWMEKGQMIPQLEQIAFSLRKGEVGPPVRTGAGVHILTVDDTKASEYVPLADVEAQITERLYGEAVEERFQDYVESDLTQGHSIVRRLDPASVAAPGATTAEEPSESDGGAEASSSSDHAG
ncbi:MAG: peptidylprolyl isomerase [Candidatus Binatia bacterium]|nr:peptidylprolyl isomerase [Candidatus Binatia bacterium]